MDIPFDTFSEVRKEQISFYIRSELFIDGIPLTWQNIEDSLTGKISARELLSQILNIKSDNESWNEIFQEADNAAIEFSDLENLLDMDIKYSFNTIKCSGCGWKGNSEELEIELEDISKTYCPDCGNEIIQEQSQTQ